jgi:hypothetical protein
MEELEVIINKTEEVKTVIESEYVSDVKILYMTDGTSYSESETRIAEPVDVLKDFLKNNPEVVKKCVDSIYQEEIEKMDMEWNDTLDEILNKKTKTRTFKIFGWTITLSKSK